MPLHASGFARKRSPSSKLNHPNIEIIYDFDSQDGIDYLVMEYIAGHTLKGALISGPLPEKEILRLGTQISEGLAAAHEHGVVHCDLKPSNVMVAPDGRPKILDFGLAKQVRPMSKEEETESLESSSGGGTLPYMAPEQLLGEPLDARTDVYALGNVLYELATGRLPFQGTLYTALANAVVQQAASAAPPCKAGPFIALGRVVSSAWRRIRKPLPICEGTHRRPPPADQFRAPATGDWNSRPNGNG